MTSHVTPPAISELALTKDTVLSSHHELQIGGIQTHVYGIEQAFKLIDNQPSKPWVVLHLVHPRTRSYTYTETLAHLVLSQYYHRQDEAPLPEYPMIAITFDLPNHGSRKLDDLCNEDWAGNNPTHAQDMFSNIRGSVQNVELVMRFLPAYLQVSFIDQNPQYNVAPPSRIIDIVSGVSLGAYVAWQVAAGGKVKASIPIIGTPYLTFMLLHRRLMQANKLSPQEADEVLFKLNKPLYELSVQEVYDQVFKEDASSYWPETLHNIVAETDREVFTDLNPSKTPMLIINSQDDPLVPARFTTPWIKASGIFPESILFEQPGVGHVCTQHMVDQLSQYLIKIVRTL